MLDFVLTKEGNAAARHNSKFLLYAGLILLKDLFKCSEWAWFHVGGHRSASRCPVYAAGSPSLKPGDIAMEISYADGRSQCRRIPPNKVLPEAVSGQIRCAGHGDGDSK